MTSIIQAQIGPYVHTIRAVGALLVLCLTFVAGWGIRGWKADATIERMENDYAIAIGKARAENAELNEKNRNTERALNKTISEISDEALRQIELAKSTQRDTDARLYVASERLRIALHTLGSACGPTRTRADPTPTASGPSASSPDDLRAYVQGRLDQAERELAEGLDASYRAGRVCERWSDAVTAVKR